MQKMLFDIDYTNAEKKAILVEFDLKVLRLLGDIEVMKEFL